MIDWRRTASSETLCRNPRAKCGDVNKKQVKEKESKTKTGQDPHTATENQLQVHLRTAAKYGEASIFGTQSETNQRERCQRGALFGSFRTTARMGWKRRPKLSTLSIKAVSKVGNDADELTDLDFFLGGRSMGGIRHASHKFRERPRTP